MTTLRECLYVGGGVGMCMRVRMRVCVRVPFGNKI